MSFFRTTRARTLRSNICGSQCDKPCYSRTFMRLGYNKPRLQYSPIPDPPATFTGIAGYKSVVLNWTEPEYKGNFKISYYTVKNITLDISTKVKGLTTTFTGLTNQPYIFTITATNKEDYASTTYNTVTVTPYDLPGAPTGVTGTRGNGQVTVSWTAPTSTGGSRITLYTVTSSPDGFTETVTIDADTLTIDTTATVTTLTNGTPYTFTVTATNSAGDSPASVASSSITPATYPNAPTELSASRGNGTATITFTAPTNNGGSVITNYLYSTDDNYSYSKADDTESPIIIVGLNNNLAYTVYLKAVNAIGNSIASNSIPMTTVTAPGAPTILLATVADSSTTVSFDAPTSTGGNAITDYLYSINGNAYISAADKTTTPITITDLSNGTEYTIRMIAVNDIGQGTESDPIIVTPGTTPVAPTINLTVSYNDITVYITKDYEDVNNNRGRDVTSYEYSTDGENYTTVQESAVTNNTLTTITGLASGEEYTIYVKAVNSLGSSSITSQSITTLE